MSIQKLIIGHEIFKKDFFSKYKNHYETLVQEGQSPEHLFITCSDSRIVPHAITNSKPGDLLVYRNIGHFVPRYDKYDEISLSLHAALEFSLKTLAIKSIIICGHSHCGACQALSLYNTENLPASPLETWIAKNEKTLLRLKSKGENKSYLDAVNSISKMSVIQQIENLNTYPIVQEYLSSQDIYGWYYSLLDGNIEYYDNKENTFEPLNALL